MYVKVWQDEWYPVAYVERDLKEHGVRIEATEEEVAEYERLCERLKELSRLFLSRRPRKAAY